MLALRSPALGRRGVIPPLVVGQALLFTREDSFAADRNDPIEKARELTVDSLGRRWAYCGGFRVDRNTLAVSGDGYGSPGRCYLSREHYAAEKAAEWAWNKLHEQTRRHRPGNGPSEDDIRRAAALLGVEIPAETDG